MASVKKVNRENRKGWRIRFREGPTEREVYLPEGTKSQATAVSLHCERLAKSRAKGIPAPEEDRQWAQDLPEGTLKNNLVRWKYIDKADAIKQTAAGSQLGPFLDSYIASRSDWKPNTTRNYKLARDKLVEYFGSRKPLVMITEADAEAWQKWIKRRYAESTTSRLTKKAKTLIKQAVKSRLIESNPFEGLKGGVESNPDRYFYVDATLANEVVEACPTTDWKLIFALARWGGLRCPSEVLTLRWEHINWDKKRMLIESPKTGDRTCPIFPELEDILNRAWDEAPEGSIYCVRGYRYTDGDTNLGTQFGRILKRAAIVPWEKPFQNCRSTRRTELANQHPDHVLNAWLGQSTEVAGKHYLQVTEEDYQKAVSVPALVPACTKGSAAFTSDARSV